MPITPFHFGPAAVAKGMAPRRFSFVAFGLTQLIIDSEPAIYMLAGMWPIHRFFHTYLGASAVALAVVILGRPICEAVIRLWNRRSSGARRAWLQIDPRISFTAMTIGSFFGAISHVFLDSIMHSDMRPLAPLSDANGLLYVISIERLHELCAASGIAGALLLLALFLRRKVVGERESPRA